MVLDKTPITSSVEFIRINLETTSKNKWRSEKMPFHMFQGLFAVGVSGIDSVFPSYS